MVTKIEKLILLDADVISHFISGGQFALLPSIFKNRKVLLDVVATELRASWKFKTYIDNVVSTGFIKEINFQAIKAVGSKLPVNSIAEYLKIFKVRSI